jgi:hypothetical protein
MSRSPRPRRAHIAQMLSLGGRHSLRASIKLQAKQREQEKRREAYKRELHEAVRNLPTLPAALAAPAAPAASTSRTVRAVVTSHTASTVHAAGTSTTAPAAPVATHATTALVVYTPPKHGVHVTTTSSAPPAASTVHALGTSTTAPAARVATTTATPTAPATRVPSATPTTPSPAVSLAHDATTPIPTCDDHGSCHGIAINYTDDENAYLAALASCTSALSINLTNLYYALHKPQYSDAFDFMTLILVGGRSLHSIEVLASLLEGNMKVALPYFAIKELCATAGPVTNESTVKYKHILKILDICLAWHEIKGAHDSDMGTVIRKLRQDIALQWCKEVYITQQEISALREMSREAADIELLYDAIPPTLFYSCARCHECEEEDQKWAMFVLRLLSADEVNIRDLHENLRNGESASRPTSFLLGNVQAACLLLKLRRLADGEWHTTYVDACMSHLKTLTSYDHGPLVESLRALEFLNKHDTSHSNREARNAKIGHMIGVANTIQSIQLAQDNIPLKKGLYTLVSGSDTNLHKAFENSMHKKQSSLPRFFAREAIDRLRSNLLFGSLQPKEQMQMVKAFDSHFPNMDESTMFAVGDTWLELAGVASSAAFGTASLTEADFPPLAPIVNRLLPRRTDRRPATKRPSGLDETPEAAMPSESSKPSAPHDEATRLVLAACGNASGLDKPPRGAYLRVAPSRDDDCMRELHSCIQSDLAFKKHFLDERHQERTIAEYLTDKVNTMRATTTHFGRRRVSHVSRPPYAMSPWTAV